MIELVKKYKIQLLKPSICYNKDTGYTIEVITVPDEIQLMAKNGYCIQILEDVGIGNRHKQQQQQQPNPLPTATDLSSATLKDSMTS